MLKDVIEMYVIKVGHEDILNQLVQNKIQWQAFVNIAMKFQAL
jgi:hypothetical protein